MLPFANTAQTQVVLGFSNAVQADYVRVSVKDAGGTFRDLSTYPGFNSVKSVHWSEKIDDPHASFDVTLLRDQYRLNLSPFVQASGVNKGFDPAATTQLIALNREVKIEVAIVAMDKQPQSSDWILAFHGRVDTLDVGHPDEMTFGGRSLGGRLSQQYIKTEYVYSYAVVAGLPVPLRIWEPSMAVTTSPLVYVLPASRGDADPGLNKFLKCSQAGTTGTTEPVWTTGAAQADGTAKWDYVGAPTSSGTDVEKVMQNILDDNRLSGDPAVTLSTPVSPAWAIRQFIQAREFTMDAQQDLAHQIGWDVRYKYSSGISDFAFTFYQPNRGFIPFTDDAQWIFEPSDYLEPTRLAVDISQIRNSVRVVYSDRADLWPDGTPKRKVIDVQDSASISQYGELWMEMQEDENGNIDSSTEATALANAALSDCSQPTAELSIHLVRGFPFVELNDMFQFNGDNRRFDGAFVLAVTSYGHVFESGKLKTTLELRGLPTIGAAKHLSKSMHPQKPVKSKNGHGASHKIQNFQGTKTPVQTFTETVGGVKIVTQGTIDKQKLLDEYEIHISKSSGFTPDPSSLICTTKAQITEHGDLDPGDTYYGRTVPRWYNQGRIIRGQPSAQQSFVPGYLKPKHINTELFRGEVPVNGSFEGFTKVEGFNVPPDNWEMGAAGTWSTDITGSLAKGVNAKDGARYLQWKNTSVATAIRSKWFPVNGGNVHELRLWFYRASMANSVDFSIEWVDSGKSAISTDTVTRANTTFTDVAWNFVSIIKTAPDGAAFARVILAKHTANTDAFYIDGVRLDDLGGPWVTIANAGMSNSWVTDGAQTVAYRIERGRLRMRGAVKSGTINTKVATLPVAPPILQRWGTWSSGGTAAEVDVNTAGDVIPVSGNTTWISLDVINFETF